MSTNLHTDHIGNLILRDGKLGRSVSSQYVTPPLYGGGRVGALSPYAVEQVNHYYAYGPRSNKEGLIILREKTNPLGEGGIIAGISTGQDKQAFKFEDKELDRTYGLDWYDIQARQYDALAPTWNAPDPLAEKYYGISPYAYCAGDPVNYGDYNGMEGEEVLTTQDREEWQKLAEAVKNRQPLNSYDWSSWYAKSDEEASHQNESGSLESGPNWSDVGDKVGKYSGYASTVLTLSEGAFMDMKNIHKIKTIEKLNNDPMYRMLLDSGSKSVYTTSPVRDVTRRLNIGSRGLGYVSLVGSGVQWVAAKDIFQSVPATTSFVSAVIALIPTSMSLPVSLWISLWGNAIVSSANAGSEFNKKADEILSDPNAIGNMMMYGF